MVSSVQYCLPFVGRNRAGASNDNIPHRPPWIIILVSKTLRGKISTKIYHKGGTELGPVWSVALGSGICTKGSRHRTEPLP